MDQNATLGYRPRWVSLLLLLCVSLSMACAGANGDPAPEPEEAGATVLPPCTDGGEAE